MHPPDPPAAPPGRPRLFLLTALAYGVILAVWFYELAVGMETPTLRYALFTLAIVLYAALSLAAVRRRPDNPQVSVFVATGLTVAATIVWPIPDFQQPFGVLLAVETAAFCLVYTLPMAVFVHLAAMIPRPRALVTRRRWVIPAAYGLAVLLAVVVFIPYVNALRPFLPWDWTVEQAMRFDGKMNHATYLLGGVVSLVLLGRSALRDDAPEGRRQATVVFLGLLPWTFRQARRLFFPLPRNAEQLLAIMSPVLILVFAVSFFVAIAGFQLFRLGPLFRKSVAYVISLSVLLIGGYVFAVVMGMVASDAIQADAPLWLQAAVLLPVGLALQPLSAYVGRHFERFFYPEKRELRELQRTLIPALAETTGLRATARHLARALADRLGLRSAALLVADERRTFYRVAAIAGDGEEDAAAAHAVLTRAELDALFPAARRRTLRREPGAAEAPEVKATLDRLGARYLVPVEFRGEPTGALVLGETRTGTEFDAQDYERLELLAQGVSAMLENARLFALATHDHLTGLAQRRVFEERLAMEMERARRAYRPFAVGMADLDDFKAVNDTRGHPAGDEVLRRVAQVLAGEARGLDVVARHGGEEFALLLPETDADGARAFGERIRAALRAAGGPIPVTLSIGFAVLGPDDLHSPPSELVRRADAALYAAKRAGKDRVQVEEAASVLS